MARPTKYKPEYAEQAKKLCMLGATDKEMADIWGISERTLGYWKTQHPEFLQALREGKRLADAEVASRLYQRAIGYSHPEDKIFNHGGEPLIVPTIKHYPPDTTAAIYWLKNRDPERWRDKPEEGGADDAEATAQKIRNALQDIDENTHGADAEVDEA